ncbi:MAG: type II toxin-antitoxin system RelE/ParE family toxin [Candidatus Marinimicrobia bacterium]|nr:type II toxin-antitoxin system RelE/ParE family toxin [bacterium]MCG2715805.1 type II toxin-antitoxin system RelE/ParE family toxin [Candidatus Neomarinimicrobiota bacterium]
MVRYRIEFKKSAYRELKSIPKKDLKRILSKIESLSEDPRPDGCKKLSALERYRIRQGNYQILYSIEDDILTIHIVKIGHRKKVYGSLE